MININNIIDHEVSVIVEKLIKENAIVYLVGGAIRDHFYNVKANDFDLEVYNISFEKLRELLADDIMYINEKFKTVKLKNIEIALARQEVKIGFNYQDYELNFDNVTPKIAVLRRDFTINALMYNFNENKLEDYVNGVEDIEIKRLVYVNNKSFCEDSTRSLRLLKYHSKLGLEIDKDTYAQAKEMSRYIKFQPTDLIIKLFKQIVSFDHLNVEYFIDILSNFFIIDNFKNSIPLKNSLLALKSFKNSISERDYYLLFITLLFKNNKDVISKKDIGKSINDFMDLQPFLIGKKKDVRLINDLLSDYHIIEKQVINNEDKENRKGYYKNNIELLLILAQCDYASKTKDFNVDGLQRLEWFKNSIINKY